MMSVKGSEVRLVLHGDFDSRVNKIIVVDLGRLTGMQERADLLRLAKAASPKR